MDFVGLFQKYFVDTLKNHYFDFNGRANRSEFWYFMLFALILNVVLSILSFLPFVGILGFLVSLALFLPELGLGARRLHDLGKSGWLQLLVLIPLLGLIFLIYLWSQKGEDQANAWGGPCH